MDILDQAIGFAVKAHSGMKRKGSETPYILHPMEAAAIVGSMTTDREVIAAAVLHDVVEDTETTLEEIRTLFGVRVAGIVAAESENKREELPAQETWELRKKETLAHLETETDVAVKMVALGDKLSNIRSFAREYRKRGDELWLDLNQKDPKRQAWYYMKIAKCLSELSEYDAYKEYVSLVNYVFKDHIGGIEYEI